MGADGDKKPWSKVAPERVGGIRTRRRMKGNASEWLSAVDGLPDIHQRLRGVIIENMPALELLRREDGPGTLFYVDPPYLHQTRVSRDAIAFEMSQADHVELLTVLQSVQGKVILSGYRSGLYSEMLQGWTCYQRQVSKPSSGNGVKGIECLWCNW